MLENDLRPIDLSRLSGISPQYINTMLHGKDEISVCPRLDKALVLLGVIDSNLNEFESYLNEA